MVACCVLGACCLKKIQSTVEDAADSAGEVDAARSYSDRVLTLVPVVGQMLSSDSGAEGEDDESQVLNQ